MCEHCEQIKAEATEVLQYVCDEMDRRNSTTEVGYMVGSRLLVLAVRGLCMPPTVYMELMCRMYSEATGLDIIPLHLSQIGGPPTDPNEPAPPRDEGPDGKLN